MELRDVVDEVEVISRAYARRHGIDRSGDWLLLKLHEEMGELTQAYLEMSGQSRHRGRDAEAAFRGEVADSLASLLLLARWYHVDLDAELENKWFAWRDVVEPVDRAGIATVPIDADPTIGVGADGVGA